MTTRTLNLVCYAALVVVVAVAIMLGASSCSSRGANVKAWNPLTWFSGSAAQAADRAVERRDTKREAVLEAAHVEVAKTAEALVAATESREVNLARRFNMTAEQLMTQATGSLKLSDLQELRQLVMDLRSENTEIRDAAELRAQAGEKKLASLSAGLAEAEKTIAATNGKLRDAFDRENALANELRNERFIKWGLAGLSVVALVGYAYLRYFAGGIPAALGSVLAAAERKSPAMADDLRGLLNAHLNRHEQASIATHYARSK